MNRTTRRILAGTLVVATLSAGAVAATAGERTPAERYEVDLPADASPGQREAVADLLADAPTPVIDSKGVERGLLRNSQLTERDGRINDRIRKDFREATGAVDEEYDALYEALRILDPVTVTDRAGKATGYFTGTFTTEEELKASTPAAEETVDRLLR